MKRYELTVWSKVAHRLFIEADDPDAAKAEAKAQVQNSSDEELARVSIGWDIDEVEAEEVK